MLLKDSSKGLLRIILKLLLNIFRLFPLNRRCVVFESYAGTQISCNPYYIYKELYPYQNDLNLIWVLSSNVVSPTDIKYVRKNSFSYFYLLSTVKFYVTNTGIPTFLPIRKSQIFINTWHGGGAYKKCGVCDPQTADKNSYKLAKQAADRTTYFLSSSKAFTQIMSPSKLIPYSRFINTGMPRNDMFFHKEEVERYSALVNKNLGISTDTFIVLYAPTYRNKESNPSFNFILDIPSLTESIKRRFRCAKVVVLFRCHYFLTQSFLTNNKADYQLMNVSTYPNMQELLCRANMLISDYSSCIWDYSFTYRPCILFTPDLDNFQNERDFYIPIKKWGFPIARNNSELNEAIELFDETLFKQAMINHHQQLGSYEQGTAAQQVSSLIMDKIKKQ